MIRMTYSCSPPRTHVSCSEVNLRLDPPACLLRKVPQHRFKLQSFSSKSSHSWIVTLRAFTDCRICCGERDPAAYFQGSKFVTSLKSIHFSAYKYHAMRGTPENKGSGKVTSLRSIHFSKIFAFDSCFDQGNSVVVAMFVECITGFRTEDIRACARETPPGYRVLAEPPHRRVGFHLGWGWASTWLGGGSLKENATVCHPPWTNPKTKNSTKNYVLSTRYVPSGSSIPRRNGNAA